MLNRLKIENFKAWREADLRFGKVTGFFGTNSAGKSSLLQLLLLLKQTRNATDRGLVLDFGGPADMVKLSGLRMRFAQTGRIYNYGMAMAAGVVVLAVIWWVILA